MSITYDHYETPFGRIHLLSDGNGIRRVILLEAHWEEHQRIHGPIVRDQARCREAVKELDEYFDGKRKQFTVPLSYEGSEFYRSVWQALLKIPYGETRSYAEIAAEIRRPKACRAVGQANRRNPLPIFVPCHRVIGKDGGLTGYLGENLDIKQQLLKLEASNK